MAIEQKGGYCKNCGRQVVVFRKGTNHILHLLLTIVTGGIWLIVWILTGVKFGGWRCASCGSSKVSRVG